MIERYFNLFTYIWCAIAVLMLLAFIVLKVRTPYGRHTNEKWGITVDNHMGWFWMELPALLIFPSLVIFGTGEKNLISWILVFLWLIHYVNRTLIYPFRLRTKGKKIPLIIVISAIIFNGVNGFLNGYYIGFLSVEDVSLLTIKFVIGILLFFTGMYINHETDKRLIALREDGEYYKIPHGWLFNYISCPNFFGEIVEWIGFALIAWNLPATVFVLWCICNLTPRALNHHAWYHETFKNYPKKRRALIPFLL